MRLRKTFLLLALCFMPFAMTANAITITKAPAVAPTAKSNTSSGTASLLPTLIGVVSNVMSINAQVKALDSECEPTSSDLDFVSNLMKEYYKAGNYVVVSSRNRCTDMGTTYALGAQQAATTDGLEPCYDTWHGYGNDDMPWFNAPRASKARVCDRDGGTGCTKDSQRIVVSDIYDLYNLIDFGPDDLLPSEATRGAHLMGLIEKCSSAKLSAAKRSLWGDFLMQSAGSLGITPNNGDVMNSVNSVINSGNGSAVSSIGGIAQQLMGGLGGM